MYSISTFDACDNIRLAAETKGDELMMHHLRSVNNDLIAAEAKYHKDCYSSYVSKSNLKHQGLTENESAHDAAFKDLVNNQEFQVGEHTIYRLF